MAHSPDCGLVGLQVDLEDAVKGPQILRYPFACHVSGYSTRVASKCGHKHKTVIAGTPAHVACFGALTQSSPEVSTTAHPGSQSWYVFGFGDATSRPLPNRNRFLPSVVERGAPKAASR